MKNLEVIRNRFLQQDITHRLGGLAANLARVASFANNPNNFEAVRTLLEESKFLIEWIAPESPPEAQVKLVEIQIQLSLWQIKFAEIWENPDELKRLIGQAQAWSKKLLELAGLVDGEKK
jgi:hypothetical protein